MMATGIDSASPAFWMLEPVTTNWVITCGVVSSVGAASEVVVCCGGLGLQGEGRAGAEKGAEHGLWFPQ